MDEPAQAKPTPAWRSRAFVQPLLVTLGGVVAWIAMLAVLVVVSSTSEPSCPGCLSSGWLPSVQSVVASLLVLALGPVTTGFIAGWSSPDYGLAIGAVLVAVLILSLAIFVLVLANDAHNGVLDGDQIRDDLFTVPLAAIALLLPIGIGFGVGRSVRGRRAQRAP